MGVQKVFIPSTHVYSERIIYVSSHEPNVDGVTLIHFSPPIIIGKLTHLSDFAKYVQLEFNIGFSLSYTLS